MAAAIQFEVGTRLGEIVRRAASSVVHRQVLEVLKLLSPDPYVEESEQTLRGAIAGQRDYWDICCVLAAFAELRRPKNYLEIGVRRGRSACVVGAICPEANLYLFDMWAANYAGVPNPGPDFVREELKRVGHRGGVQFISGRSQQTVPAFIATNPSLSLDLITVDGDHRDAGALTDLNNVASRIAEGGMLVFDDIVHPQYPTLGDTWRAWVGARPEFDAHENTRDGNGTALALRTGGTRCGS